MTIHESFVRTRTLVGDRRARRGDRARQRLPLLVNQIVTRPLGVTDTSFVVTDRARLAWPYATQKPAPRR
jgi:hypothetical protein